MVTAGKLMMSGIISVSSVRFHRSRLNLTLRKVIDVEIDDWKPDQNPDGLKQNQKGPQESSSSDCSTMDKRFSSMTLRSKDCKGIESSTNLNC